MRALAGLGLLVVGVCSWACGASAEPIKLKMAYYTSDRTTTYRVAIKPFVEAVNNDARGLLQIDVGISGRFGRNPILQLQLVLDGTVDLAFIVPGYTPERFPDNTLIELPGLYQDIREATWVYSRMLATNRLRGYEDLVVIGAFASSPETIHTRLPVNSLADLAGRRIRTNNPVQAAALARLDVVPVQMAINQVASAISGGRLDGATAAPTPLIEFGIGRVAPNHYLLDVSSAPLALVVNRARFEKLPERARQIVGKFSGDWAANNYIDALEQESEEALRSLKRDPERRVVLPSQSDRHRAAAAFKAEVDAWTASAPRHRNLLAAAQAILAAMRGGPIDER